MSNALRAKVFSDELIALRSCWRRPLITLAVAVAALTALYWETATSIVNAWSTDPLGHGYVVVPLVAYLLWQRRGPLLAIVPRAEFVGLPVIALLAFVWLLGNLTDTRVVQQACWVGMIVGFVWVILGSSAARVLIYPLGFLVFALPLGDRFIPILQDLAARITVKLLATSGVPVLLQAHVITIPGGEWKVAEACSGINYLTASLALGYVYAGTAYRYWAHRIGFLAGAALVPLLANGLRVYGTIFIASKAGAQSIAGTKHYLFGWVVFALMMTVLFIVCGRWREESAIADRSRVGSDRSAAPRWRAVLATAVALLLVSVPVIVSKSYASITERRPKTLEPAGASGKWKLADTKRYTWSPHFKSPSAELTGEYRADDHSVKLYIGYFAPDQMRGKLAGAGNTLFPPPWSPKGWRSRSVRLAGGQQITVKETRIEGGLSSLLVWNWYWVDGTVTSNDTMAQLYLATARLLRRPEGSAALAIATEDRLGLEPEAVLMDFLLHVSLTPILISNDRPDDASSGLHR